ncbi:hypothetical protein Q3G72_027247 [Acer saccharum]|nr:hypothetical protein Q3G72_027247 [Acer saccharum]
MEADEKKTVMVAIDESEFSRYALRMDKSDDASIDIKSLATCLRDKLENLYPLSKDCCIYRVPSELRNSKGSPDTPQIVSIGPLHHGREELKDYQLDIEIETIRTPTLLTITELQRAGVKFEVRSNKHLIDMFETLHCETNHVNDYAMLASLLVSSPKDAELLIQNGILENTGSVATSTFCAEIGNQARVSYNRFYYIDLARDLNDYCKSPWRKWNANLKQNYFNSPWATISIIAAVLLLLLTITQTVCSIIAL